MCDNGTQHAKMPLRLWTLQHEQATQYIYEYFHIFQTEFDHHVYVSPAYEFVIII